MWPRCSRTSSSVQRRPHQPATSELAQVWRRSCQRTGRVMPAAARWRSKRSTFFCFRRPVPVGSVTISLRMSGVLPLETRPPRAPGKTRASGLWGA
ncbi:hypothetical protein BE11_05505 [Sorangium cellulosum]|nr:hypothetical protein BE11_05505 [Sorangium cellulosum]